VINALQIIGSLPNLNLYIPANVIDFYGFVNDIQTLNFISTDKIFVLLNLAIDNDESSFTPNNSARNLASGESYGEDYRSFF
jgi:hypothetical protein